MFGPTPPQVISDGSQKLGRYPLFWIAPRFRPRARSSEEAYRVTSNVVEPLPVSAPSLEAVASTVYIPTPSRFELTF